MIEYPYKIYAEIDTAFFYYDYTRDDVSSYLKGRCWSYKSNQYTQWSTFYMFQYYHCIWLFDPIRKKQDILIPIWRKDGTNIIQDFVTMSYYGEEYEYTAVCLTRLGYNYSFLKQTFQQPFPDGKSKGYDCHVRLYDQYGNSFWVTVIRNHDSGGSFEFTLGVSTSNP